MPIFDKLVDTSSLPHEQTEFLGLLLNFEKVDQLSKSASGSGGLTLARRLSMLSLLSSFNLILWLMKMIWIVMYASDTRVGLP